MDSSSIRVAYTLEQCWHDAPGGTAIAALRIARELRRDTALAAEIDLHLVAGKHAAIPPEIFRPEGAVAMLPLARPLLYESWTRLNWPKVESVTGPIDVAHATGLIPCGTSAPLVVTIHDVAFLHTPEKFTKHGAKSMMRSLDVARRRADRVVCPSRATMDDCRDAGFADDQLRLVPLGVDVLPATVGEIDRVRTRFDLPERFVLFVGTLEPRKNLRRLVTAMSRVGGPASIPLVIAGAGGWGDERDHVEDAIGSAPHDVRFVGSVSDAELRGLYAAATVFAYPSEREGFGLPVSEAMAQGTAVVTSRGTSTEEVADGAAVLVDPFDVDDIARGVSEALDRAPEMADASRRRAGELSWTNSAHATAAVYRELVS
ncbi:glycosyltransferase family 4 protein [Ilumatobacter sp.]|uniref:glycosyltransferase family 4 protein n=1 Tax=Ilumatobacter sp. TaxID=1967498 RepID=UPI003C51D6D9